MIAKNHFYLIQSKHNMSNYKLALLELYSPLKHGSLPKKNENLYGHYLILDTIDLNEFYENIDQLNNDTKTLTKMYKDNMDRIEYEMNVQTFHPFIRNYKNMMKNPKQFEIQIIKPYSVSIGDGDWNAYSMAVNKTHWIRLIQRRWIGFQKKRLQMKKNISHLKYKEIHGRLPAECDVKFNLGLK